MYSSKKEFSDELTLIWASKIAHLAPSWYRIRTVEAEIADAWKMYLNARNSQLNELLLGDIKLRSHLEVLKNFGTTSGTRTTMERGTLSGRVGNKNNAAITEALVQGTAQSLPGYKPANGIAHIRRGSVLNDGWWWPFKNDAWVIGGVHGLKRFHLTLAAPPDDLLWEKTRPRVLGRELLGLEAFDYSLIGVPTWAKPVPKPTTPNSTQPQSTAIGTTAVQLPSDAKPATIPVSATDIRATIGNVFAPQSKTKAKAATFTSYYATLDKVTGINDIKNGILKNEVAFEKYDFAKI